MNKCAPVLEGVRVLDLSQYMAGPYCTALLADMGAEVIRIEMPGGAGDREQGPSVSGQNLRFWLVSRNKKGITLNISLVEGKQLFHKLVKQSDILVNSYILPVKKKLGLSYEEMKQVNPGIIQVDISGFGDSGPDADRLCFDHLAQAESGAMSYAGFEGNPPVRWPISWIDMSTGLEGAYGAVLALLHRGKTGHGQRIEVSLFHTAMAGVSFVGHTVAYKVLGEVRRQMGNAGYYTFSNVFSAKDGMVFLDATTDRLWQKFTEIIGRPELAQDPRFGDDTLRYQNRDLLIPVVQQWVGERTVAEVCQVMRESRLPYGRVNSIVDVMDDPRIEIQQLFVNLDVPGPVTVPHPRIPLTLSETPPEILSVAPQAGQHNEQVYCDILGLSKDELNNLIDKKVI